MSCGFVPANTAKNTKWAVGVFKSWLESRNQRTGETIDANFLDKRLSTREASRMELCHVHVLSFVVEARKQDGKPYPAKTLYYLLAGILRYMRDLDPKAPNFLDQNDSDFKKLHGTMDTHFRALQQGVGAQVNHAKLLTLEEENLMWELGVMGSDTPRALLQAIFLQWEEIFATRRRGASWAEIFSA